MLMTISLLWLVVSSIVHGSVISPQRRSFLTKREYSLDGRCGAGFNNLECDPNSQNYNGGCCSQYGWCGDTVGHCGTGCQSGCTPVPRQDGRCGAGFGNAPCDPNGEYGGCCSSAGWCGSTTAHCGVGCQSGCEEPEPTEPRQDGRCGASFGYAVCDPEGEYGGCCSASGWCGVTVDHCGVGCQSGCVQEPIITYQPPEPTEAIPGPSPAAEGEGPAPTVVGNSGVPAMHAALMPNGKFVFLDKVENYTELTLPNENYAYSSEYDIETHDVVPLAYLTNSFCSGGTFLADGRLLNVGGNGPLDHIDDTVGDGFRGLRYLERSSTSSALDGDDWTEPGNQLDSARWYASAQTLADGRVFVASGSLNGLDPMTFENNNPTYEILSAVGVSESASIPMEILVRNQPYYMYPFIHLLKSGDLFVFVSKEAQIFDVGNNDTVLELPDLPGAQRTYPNTGGSVMLALSSANNWEADIVICGGGNYQDITSPTEASCGRIRPEATTPTWQMESMPQGRTMVEGVHLPDGQIVWINGASTGAQGFRLAEDPALTPLLYDPEATVGQRFTEFPASEIPRMYHSVAMLGPDANVYITGSNPNEMPRLEVGPNTPFITDFRVERWVPPYLQDGKDLLRPTNVVLSSTTLEAAGGNYTVDFDCPITATEVKVSLLHGGFITHSLHMGARLLFLDTYNFDSGVEAQTVTFTMPPSINNAPPGPYMLFVLCDGIPSVGQFVSVPLAS